VLGITPLSMPLVGASQATSIRLFLSQQLSGRAGDSTGKSGRPVTLEFVSRRRCVSWGRKQKFHEWRRWVLCPFHSLPWLLFSNYPTEMKSANSKVVPIVASECCHRINKQLEKNTRKWSGGGSVRHPERCGGVALLDMVQKPQCRWLKWRCCVFLSCVMSDKCKHLRVVTSTPNSQQ